MLETDEVDIDYFTPAGSTSLASIFGKNSAADEANENTSLKYVPPPPPDKSKTEEVKPKQLIFTCAVNGFEWTNSGYINRGKLGLTILKMPYSDTQCIILYDSNKTTLSCVTISPKLNIHIRDVSTISYYDSTPKYWSIKTSDNDMNKITQLLTDLQATIVTKSSEENDKEQSSVSKGGNEDNVVMKEKESKEEHETDTDYMNQKTKDSILKRMANMGQSVLPQHAKAPTSDSSESNDTEDNKKNIRHKPIKIPPKKCTDSNVQENESNTVHHSKKLTHKFHIDSQGPSKTIATTPAGNEMNIFISEQRISNSELRINVNRVADKLDVVMDKLNDVISLEKMNSSTSFQNDIVQKLVREYESKIKYYEYIMNSKGIDFHSTMPPGQPHLNENVSNNTMKHAIDELNRECEKKDKIIRDLEKNITVLNNNIIKINEDNKKDNNELIMEIETLNKKLNTKTEELYSIEKTINSEKANNQESCNIVNKVKKIMNDTFEAISVNFDDNESYSGDTVKAVIAIVIKKTTINALQDS